MMYISTMKTHYAITRAGGIRKLADILKITTTAIYAWGEVMPPLRAFQFSAWLKERKQE
jgi:hypothetical protein